MKTFVFLSFLFSLTCFAQTSDFQSLKSRADAYRDSGQQRRDQEEQLREYQRSIVPEGNRNLLVQARGWARFHGGLLGKMSTGFDANGYYLFSFETRGGWSCQSEEKDLLCINRRTLEQQRHIMIAHFARI